jgi:hypothetical protein
VTTKPLARNLRRLGHLDLPGGGQVVTQGDYVFIGHMKPPHSTTIVDIADPRRPRVVYIPEPVNGQPAADQPRRCRYPRADLPGRPAARI